MTSSLPSQEQHVSIPRLTPRQLALEYVRAIDEPLVAFHSLDECISRFRQLRSTDLVVGLTQLLDDSDGDTRVNAAYRLLEMEEPSQKALRVMVNALQGDDVGLMIRAAVCLSLLPNAPPETVPPLKRLVDSNDFDLKLVAANVLREPTSDILVILGQGLRSENIIHRITAARTLILMSFRLDEAVRALLEVLDSSDSGLQCFCCLALIQSKREHSEAAATLRRLVLNPKADIAPRALGCAALAAVTGYKEGASEAVAVLCASIAKRSWSSLRMAAEVLKKLGAAPPRAMDALSELLKEEDAFARNAGILAVRELGAIALPSLPQLMERARVETQPEAVWLLARTIAGVGALAIPFLVDLLETGEMPGLTVGSAAFALVGEEAAPALGRIVFSHQNPLVREMAAHSLHYMGSAARAVVPAIIPLLDDDDHHKILTALIALGSIGADAREAAPRIARLLLHEHPELADRAEKALLKIGIDAIPPLKECSRDAQGTDLARITSVLNRLGVAASLEAPGLEAIDDDRLLRFFLSLGEILEGGPTSLTTLEITLGQSSGGIRKKLAKLRQLIHRRLGKAVHLTAQGRGRNGAYRLAEDGAELLGQVRQYFARKGRSAQG
jgi:hypothetical protein